MTNKKYVLQKNKSITILGKKLFRIKALISIPSSLPPVEIGDEGGYVESEKNLSFENRAWIHDDAKVFGSAVIYGDAHVSDNALVYDNATIDDTGRAENNAKVYGDASVYGNGWVLENAEVYGRAQVYDNARIFGKAKIYDFGTVNGKAKIFGNNEITRRIVTMDGVCGHSVAMYGKFLQIDTCLRTFEEWGEVFKRKACKGWDGEENYFNIVFESQEYTGIMRKKQYEDIKAVYRLCKDLHERGVG